MNMQSAQTSFLEHVIDADKAVDPAFAGNGEAGLAIYRFAYRARLISCLRATYDKSWGWMGDDRFDAATTAHIAQHIPHSWSLDNYGVAFDETLASLFPDDPEIADLAKLEWEMQAAFVKPDSLAADHNALAAFVHSGQDIERLRLWLVPSFSSFPISTNCAAIWRAIEDGHDMPPLEYYDSPHIIAIWRTGFTPHFRDIDGIEATALLATEQGTDFGDVCKMLVGTGENDGIRVSAGSWLGRWITDGMIAQLTL